MPPAQERGAGAGGLVRDVAVVQQYILQSLTLGDSPAALRMAQQWVTRAPDAGESWLTLSAVLGRMGNYADAIRAARRAAAAGLVISRGPESGWPRVLTLVTVEQGWCTYQAGKGMSFATTADINDGLIDSARETIVVLNGRDRNIPWGLIRRHGPFDVLFNAITVAERAPASLGQVASVAGHLGLPVINEPHRVARTSRVGNFEQLRGLTDVYFPRTVAAPLRQRGRAAGDEILRAVEREGFEYPLIVRYTGYQTGAGMVRCDSPKEVQRLSWPRHVAEAVLIEYVETRSPDGHYRKIRLFGVGEQLIPRHLLIGDVWMLHVSDDSGTAYRNTPGPERDDILAFDADWEAWAGPRAASGFRQVQDTIGLDFLGMDCAVLPDGRALIFEANPAMNLQVLEAFQEPEDTPHPVRRINAARSRQIARAFAELVQSRCHARD